jgi:hypothetical protein
MDQLCCGTDITATLLPLRKTKMKALLPATLPPLLPSKTLFPLALRPSLPVLCSPYVWEFSRLNLQYVMLSKRNILKLVRDAAGVPLGWQTVGHLLTAAGKTFGWQTLGRQSAAGLAFVLS